MTSLTSLSELIAGWAAANPRVQRVWLSAGPGIAVTLELLPVSDSEETIAVWLARGDGWRAELNARLGAPVDIDWYDPDKEVPPPPADGTTLVYQRAA
jgi:hypothetical protein